MCVCVCECGWHVCVVRGQPCFQVGLNLYLHTQGGWPASFQTVLLGSQMHTARCISLSLCRFRGSESGCQSWEPSDFPQRATSPALRKAFVVEKGLVGYGRKRTEGRARPRAKVGRAAVCFRRLSGCGSHCTTMSTNVRERERETDRRTDGQTDRRVQCGLS